MTAARRRSSDGAHSGSAAAPELPATSHLLVDRSHLGTPWLRFRGRSPWPEGRRPDRERASHACRGWQHRRVRLRHTHRGGPADRRLHLSALARSSTTTSRSSATGSGTVSTVSDSEPLHCRTTTAFIRPPRVRPRSVSSAVRDGVLNEQMPCQLRRISVTTHGFGPY